LAGTLRLGATSAPALGQTFQIIGGGPIFGQFDQIILPDLPGDFRFFTTQTTRMFAISGSLLGDMDKDFDVDGDDIDDFVLALVNPTFYQDTHMGHSGWLTGDFDSDELVDLDDVPGFEAVLSAAGFSASILDLVAIPEPSSVALAAMSLFVLLPITTRSHQRCTRLLLPRQTSMRVGTLS
jgi:hypothetical protein